MAAIRSHLISLFSGGIFPDRKWWFSCFCVPHSKEEKPVRQLSKSNEKVIYTIQMNEDEELKTEFDFDRCSMRSNLSEKPALSSEAASANGYQMLVLEGQSLNRHARYKQSNEYHDGKFAASLSEDLDDSVSDINLTSYTRFSKSKATLETTNTEYISAECCVLPSKMTDTSDLVNILNKEDSLTLAAEFVITDGREESVTDENERNKGSAFDLLSAINILYTSIVDENADQNHLPDTDLKDKLVQNDVISCENDLISEDRVKRLEADHSITDLLSKAFSDLETSGILSNSVNYEDTPLHLSSSCDNSYESIDDSDASIQFTNSHLASLRTVLLNSESYKIAEDQYSTTEPQDSMIYENDNMLKRRNQVTLYTSSLCDIYFSESGADSLIQPVETSIYRLPSQPPGTFLNNKTTAANSDKVDTELCSGVTADDLVQFIDHDYCVAHLDHQEPEETYGFDHGSSDEHYIVVNDHCRKSCADVKSLCQGRAEKLMVHRKQLNNIEHITDPELKMSSNINDEILISRLSELNASQVENKEMKVECYHAFKPGIFSAEDGKVTNADRKWNNTWNIKDLIADDTVGPIALLQVKLLLRSDSYEMLESLVKWQTSSLLNDALDRLLSIKGMKMINYLLEDSRYFQDGHLKSSHYDTIDNNMWNNGQLPNVGGDPFLMSTSEVFEEALIGNYEQLFDSEEWLDDDFGFSSIVQGKPPPPYPDRVNDSQKFSRIVLRIPDLEYEDNSVLFGIIQLVPEKIFPVIDQAMEIFWSSRRYGEPWNEVHPPETYFTPEDRCGTLEDCSRKSHKAFLFDLVAEILQEIYSDELKDIPHPWQLVNSLKIKQIKDSPTTIDVLKPVIRNLALQSLRIRKEHPSEKIRKLATMSRQVGKGDYLDRLLVNEMYQEEPGWTDYNKDVNFIKNHIANKLFFSLINDTAKALQLLQSSYGTKCG